MLFENIHQSRVDISNKRNNFLKNINCRVFKLSAPNFYCSNFHGRAVQWVFSLGFVCKSRVESRDQSVTRDFKQTTTTTGTRTSPNKSFNEKNNGCTRAL